MSLASGGVAPARPTEKPSENFVPTDGKGLSVPRNTVLDRLPTVDVLGTAAWLYGLGIVQQAMTRERFRFISKHTACVRPV